MAFSRKYKQFLSILFILIWTHIDLCAAVYSVASLNNPPVSMQVGTDGAADLAQEAGSEAAKLFDRDTGTTYVPEGPSYVDVNLGRSTSLSEIRFHGAADAAVTVMGRINGQWREIKGLKDLDIGGDADQWHRFELPKVVETDGLRFQWIPKDGAAPGQGLGEIEIRSQGEPVIVRTGEDLSEIMDAGVDADQGRLYWADRESGCIGPEAGEYMDFEDDNIFRFVMAYAPSQIRRAYLRYDLSGLEHWSSAVRTINDQPAMGGYVIERGAGGGQIEEISPDWLKQGVNTLRFVPIGEDESYEVGDVALMVELDNGANFIRYVRSNLDGDADGIGSLYDGDLYSGLPAADPGDLTLRTGWVRNPGLKLADGEAVGGGAVELGFDRATDLTGIEFYATKGLKGSVSVSLKKDGAWTDSAAALDPKPAEGWQSIQIDDGRNAEGARIVFSGLKSGKAEIREVRAFGSAAGAREVPAIHLNFPDSGQYFEDRAYVRGFVTPADNGSGTAALYAGDRQINHINGEFEALIDVDDPEASEAIELTAVYPDGMSTAAVLPLQVNRTAENSEIEIRENGVEEDEDEEEEAGTANDLIRDENRLKDFHVPPGQAKKFDFEGAAVEMENGAVRNPMKLRMMTLRGRDLAALDAGMVNVTGKFKGYRFLPHGMKFGKKVKIKLPYSKRLIPEGFKEDDVQTFFFNEDTGSWWPLERESVDAANSEVVSLTDHFTDMINAVVQVPESPQAASFNPTQMSDIKAADPSAKHNLMEPPKANNQGTANLSYPIEVPPGRRGMQPQLGVQYNSGGGNGWMGHYWDLPMQAVGIDTRWGVPRYDDARETETYTVSGQQLTPVAHRGEPDLRTADKIFHTRVEGGFQKIIRHGDHPFNYWWEVIDKNGTHFFYGGDPETGGPTEDSTLTDENGNIGKWALRLIRDSNGNTIEYRCVRVYDTGLANGRVMGAELYLSEIFYTGYRGQRGPYRVQFIRDRELGESGRNDVTIDARLGFKKVTADLLRKVEVYYGEQKIRSYAFGYRPGVFIKTLLESITQLDNGGNVFNTHSFEYHDEARNADGTLKGFGPAQVWQTGNDNVRVSGMMYNGNASAMGGSYSNSNGGHVSVGFNPFKGEKKDSVGGKVGFNKSKSKGIAALIDVNGDGLPDKVYDYGTKYRPNLSGPDGITRFGNPVSFNLGQFSVEKSDMFSSGLEAYIGSGFVGVNASRTFTEGSVYLSDVNGDGLVDQVKNGAVRFALPQPGSPDPQRPKPIYSINAYDTPAPISGGAIDGEGLIRNFEELRRQILEDNPLHDTFKAFRVPFAGFIRISGDVALIEDTSQERTEYKTADGVRVAVQYNGDELWVQAIEPDDFTPYMPENLERLRVNRGDRIYFRVGSRFDGAYDQVSWNPRIEYLNVPEVTDENGLNPWVYEAASDFIPTGRSNIFVSMPQTGSIRISGDAEKLAQTSDDIRVVIYHNGAEVYSQMAAFDSTGIVPVDLFLNVESQDQVMLKIEADSPIDLTQIEWRPRIVYESAEGMDTVTDPEGNPMIVMNPPYTADVYGGNNLSRPLPTWKAPESGTIIVSASVWTKFETGKLSLAVKKENELVRKRVLDLAHSRRLLENELNETDGLGDFIIDPRPIRWLVSGFEMDVEEGEEFFFTMSCRNGAIAADTRFQVAAVYKTIEVYDETGTEPTFEWTAEESRTYTVLPSIESDAESGEVMLTAWGERQDGKGKIKIVEKAFDISDAAETMMPISAVTGANITFEFSAKKKDVLESISEYGIKIQYTPFDNGRKMPCAYYFPVRENLFAQPYRGWAYAAYNGNEERGELPISEADLNDVKSGEGQRDQNKDKEDPEELEGDDSPEKGKAVVFFPEPVFKRHPEADPEYDRWRGFDDGTWVTAEMISSSRLNIDYPPIPEPGEFGTAQAVNRLSQSTQKGLAGSISTEEEPKISASGNFAIGESWSMLDYLDLNGDRYPDIVSENRVQFTLPTGGLEPRSRNILSDIRKSGSLSWGAGVSGNFPETKSDSGGRLGHSGLQMAPLGVSGNFNGSEDWRNSDFKDINGDGLPDKVDRDGYVRLNLGYRFAPKERWSTYEINEGGSNSFSGGVSGGLSSLPKGSNDGRYGFGGGISVTQNIHEAEKAWIDINGDGLTDFIQSSGSALNVGLNTGNGFMPITYPGINHAFSKNVSTSQNAGVYFTIGIPLCPGGCYIVINPGVDTTKSISRPEISIMDIDGDGYPDYLEADKDGALGTFDDNELKVRRNQIGKTNLLKTVRRPLGASFTIDYERDGNTYQMPQSRWNMTKVTVNDGFPGDGPDTLVSTFRYEGGLYDRREREFYGYETVITEQPMPDAGEGIYRSTAQTFKTGSYYEKGLLVSQSVMDGAGKKYAETVNQYQFREVSTGEMLDADGLQSVTATIFPQLIRADKRFYEGQDEPGIVTHQTFAYDELGNVVHFFDAADAGDGDDVESFIEYHRDEANYIVGKAKKITVKGSGETMRVREAVFEAGTGNLKQVRISLGDGAAVHEMAYDAYGNIISQTGPANKNGQRYQLAYTYDDAAHTYVRQIRDSFGYASSADYDLRWGEVTRTTDINSQSITYRHDSVGRVVGITGPKQQGESRETLTFAYHPDGAVPWALTRHFDNYDQAGDPLETALFIDGLKRNIQTKKDGTVSAGGKAERDVMIVSGRVIFDFAGRSVAQYYPVTENPGSPGTFNPSFDGVQPARTVYDVMDRPLETTLPDDTRTLFAYGFGEDRNGSLRFMTRVTDAKGNAKVSYKDVRELITAMREFNEGQTIWTSYAYDPMRQIVSVKDNRGNVTSVRYDFMGRRTHIDSPDMGLTETVYDGASNVVKKITANLRAAGKAIEYDYTYNRLDSIRYPEHPENNVVYTYGAPGAANNRAGRIVTVTDASGEEERFYGSLGETVKTVRYVTSATEGNSGNSPEIYVSEYAFDTYNRMRQMIYPDGEVLTYGYNAGGLVASATGKKGDYEYPYLKALTYDKFEQRVYMQQGNGVDTTYDYNPANRRLAALEAESRGKPFMSLAYAYDPVGNILGLENRAEVKNKNSMGGRTAYSFEYDDLYRLTESKGRFAQPNNEHTFTLSMKYDSIHNIVSKDQRHLRIGNGGSAIEQQKTTYGFGYDYGSARPHAPTQIGDRSFSYDANGNQTGWESDQNGAQRKIYWDEENRIQKIEDNGKATEFKYNHAGERVFKIGRHGETVYVNQFYTVGNRENGSKHFFIGATRIATKMVKGQEDAMTSSSDVVGSGSGNPGNGSPNPPGNAYGLEKNGKGSAGGKQGNVVYEPDVFYYHPDHLGSTSYVTDVEGEVYQHLEYFPFGETWVEEMSGKNSVPYLFTAKELDEETGLYYFGARYYDPRISVWVSCDPILHEYLDGESGLGGVFNAVNLNLFNYGNFNPIRYIDPDGNEVYSAHTEYNQAILNDINYIAGGGFYFDENDRLQINEDYIPEGNYSKTFRNDLISQINNTDTNITIDYSESVNINDPIDSYNSSNPQNNGQADNVYYLSQGCARFADKEGKNFYIWLPHTFRNGDKKYMMEMFNVSGQKARAIILAHEFSGHVVPTIDEIYNGKDISNSYAEKIENKIRSEKGGYLPRKLIGDGSSFSEQKGFEWLTPDN